MIKPLAAGLALNRIAFGVGYLVAPERAAGAWVAQAAADRRTQVLVRALGARDLALGVGALRALAAADGSAQAWFGAHAVADATDLAATLAARDYLPRRNLRFASAIAGVSTAIALAATLAPPCGRPADRAPDPGSA
jgi:hypothetical protein